MGHFKPRTQKDDEFTHVEAKADRRDRRQADADEKAANPPKSRGLRSQGDVGIIEADRPLVDHQRGRRAPPTRYDAMPIAGHQRLTGYETSPMTGDEDIPYAGTDIARPAPFPGKPPPGPDPLKSEAAQPHDLQQSSEDAVGDAIQDASQDAFHDAAFDEHVASTDLPRRSKSADEDDEDKGL